MKFNDFVAVSGLPGLYKVVANRNNGLIVEDIDTGKSKFLSVRKYQFTPLETVAIYTEDDPVELGKVFKALTALIADGNAIPSLSEPTPVLFDYFGQILPDYDRDRVFASDVKKVLKWYKFLLDRNLLSLSDEEE